MAHLRIPALPVLRTSHLLGALLTLVIGASCIQAASLLYLAREAQTNKTFLTSHPFTRYDKLRQLRNNLGYGGLAFNFKNAILRGRDTSVYAERAMDSAQRVIDIISQYRSLPLSADETQALGDIEGVVRSYQDKLPQIQNLHAEGRSLAEIDAIARIDDSPSLAGVRSLDLAVQREMGVASLHMEQNTDQISMVATMAAVTSVLSLLTLLGSVMWFRRLNIANLLRDLLGMARNLANADTSQLERDATRADEIGTIARAILSYRDIAASQKGITNAVFGAVHDAIITIDRKGLIQAVNPAGLNLFGYELDEMTGRNIKMLMPDTIATQHDGYLSGYKSHGQGHSTVIGRSRELEGRRKDGSTFPIELNVSEMLMNGEMFFTGVVRDISDRKKQQDKITAQTEELAKRAQELERSNADLEDFAYIASHDLREPLRGLFNFASFLKEDYADKLDDNGKRQLDGLMKLSQRLDALVSSLLYYSRVGRQDLAQKPTNLHAVVAGVMEELKPYLDEHHATVTFSDDLPVLTCDHVRISEVFRNLITNAIKYNDHEDGKRVEVGIRTDSAPWPVLFVRDNGIGIDQQHRETVFKMFKRLHKRDAYQGGTGAGLTITKKIVERHGGKIWVEENPDGGSVFCFTLPEPAAESTPAPTADVVDLTPQNQPEQEDSHRDAA